MISGSNEANFGQTEINGFPEILFSVAAKHVGFMENDFRKRFSANSNTALVEKMVNINLKKKNPRL